MKVMLKINGWFKEEDVDDYSVKRGIIEVQFFQAPVKYLVQQYRAVVPRVGSEPVLRLVHAGEYIQNLPVFEWKG